MSSTRPTSRFAAGDGGAAGVRTGLSDLRRRAAGGAAWIVVGLVASNLLRLGGNVVLARLLFPEAFGLMALAQVFMQGLLLFCDVGTGAAIIRDRRGDEPAFLDTAWTLHLLRGLTLCAVSFALAWPVSAFYGATDPLARDLVYYLPALGLSALLDGAASTRLHAYGRHLRVRQLTLLELHNQTVSALVMIGVAWVYPSVWALVAGALVRSVLRTALSHTVLDGPRNRLRLEPDALRVLFQFGKWILVSTILTFLAAQVDRLLLGRLLSLQELGVYGIALALAGVPVNVLARVGSRVVFPTLSRLEGGPQQLQEAARARARLLVLGALLFSCVLPAGPRLISALYDARYQEAGWILQTLLLGGWFQVLESPNTALLLAKGDTRAVAAGNAVKLVGLVVLLPLGFFSLGLPGGILGIVAADAARYAVSAFLAARRGLHVLRRDAAMTLGVLTTSAAGVAASSLAHAEGAGTLVSLALATVGALPWALVALSWLPARERGLLARPRLAGGGPRPAADA